MKKISAIALLSGSILFTGCNQQPYTPTTLVKKPTKTIVKKESPQKLVINYTENTIEKKKTVSTDKTIILNNIDKPSVTLTLTNRGDKDLNIKNISMIDNNNMFKITNNNCDTTKKLAGGKSCKLTVNFTGNDDAKYYSMLTIQSDDTKKQISNIAISGISQNKFKASLSSTKDKKIVKRDLELNFNASDSKQYITVSNNGIEDLQLGSLKLIGPDRNSFEFDSQCQKTLAVGKTCEVALKYKKDVKEGQSLAQLYIPSNGEISPSSKTRLIGYSKPFYLSLEKFVVSKNIKDFMDDYFTVGESFYVRTIFQNNIDQTLETYINSEIKNYLTKNGIRLSSTASIADKIITIYPTLNILKSDDNTNDMTFAIKINGSLSTKANTNGKIKTQDNEVSFNHKMGMSKNSTDFNSISVINKFVDKEDFEFAMKIQVDNVTDKYEVYNTVSTILSSKLFNVIGIQNKSGK